MKTEGTKIIFARSIKSQMRHTELYGDGGSKIFITVENNGEKVIKGECIRHLQERVGAHYKCLKKETKGIGEKEKLRNAVFVSY